MYLCTVCHFWADLDDVVMGNPMRGTCICYRCFRLAMDDPPMGKVLRRELQQVLSAIPGG